MTAIQSVQRLSRPKSRRLLDVRTHHRWFVLGFSLVFFSGEKEERVVSRSANSIIIYWKKKPEIQTVIIKLDFFEIWWSVELERKFRFATTVHVKSQWHYNCDKNLPTFLQNGFLEFGSRPRGFSIYTTKKKRERTKRKEKNLWFKKKNRNTCFSWWFPSQPIRKTHKPFNPGQCCVIKYT